MTWPVPEIDEVDMAFPAHAMKWIPPHDEIPPEFSKASNEWARFATSWFALGLPADVRFYPTESVDPEKAYNVLYAILRSYAPPHQHKLAAVAYLASQWFTKVEGWEGGYVDSTSSQSG